MENRSNPNLFKEDANLDQIEMLVVDKTEARTNTFKIRNETFKVRHQFNAFWCLSAKKPSPPRPAKYSKKLSTVKSITQASVENCSNNQNEVSSSGKKNDEYAADKKKKQIDREHCALLNSKKSIKTILVTFDSDDETENTSIVGYKSTPNSINMNQLFI